jgi:hypothetical protein
MVGVVAAAVTIAAVFAISDRLFGAWPAAALAAAALLVARGFWLFATQAPSYIPSIACLALLMLALLAREGGSGFWRRTGAPALALAAAVLFHQSAVIIVIAIVVFLLVSEGRSGIASAAAILVPAGVVVLAAYAAAYAWTDGREIVTQLRGTRPSGLAGFVQYLEAYRYHPCPFWATWANLGPAGIARAIRSQVWDLVGYPPGWITPAMRSALAIAGGALLALLLGDHLRGIGDPSRRAARAFLLAWLFTSWLYVTWVAPPALEYFVAPLVPLLLLAALSAERLARSVPPPARARLALAGTAIAAAVVTLNGAAVWPEHRSKGAWNDEALRMSRVVPADWTVGDTYPVDQHLAYYFDRPRVIAVPLVQLYYYRGGSPPAALAPPETTCFVVPMSLVVPECDESGISGYARPADWLRFVGWVLDLRADSHDGALSARSFRVIEPAGGAPLLLVLPARRAVGGMASLLAELDDRLPDAAAAGAPGPFTRWWRQVGARHADSIAVARRSNEGAAS